MSHFRISGAQVTQYNADGYLIVPGLLDAAETRLLADAARADRELLAHASGRADRSGKPVDISLWNHPGDDIYGTIARSERVVRTMERLLGGEVYHYHSKMILKQPRVAGAWEWHQDYGYWYSNGCLFPELASVMIAVDPATRANGCLQVLRGSHLMGRIEHGRFAGQTCADPERVEQALERMELVYAELAPGDAVFFHCNTLHRSDANTSDQARWTLICCYNSRHNDPYKESHHPRYTPLEVLPDGAILTGGARTASGNDSWLDPARDRTSRVSTG
ncbi:MAG: Ectoine dioxygenase [Phycisphaerae bacterium]|nr:Ectoine dioxygenase [Phycisphaerae bacterium]